MAHGAQMTDLDAIRTFVLAGNATFTLVSKATGARFTYKAVAPQDSDKIRFVKVLNGPDNWTNYQYVGNIVVQQNRYYHGKKAKISADAPSARAFAWFFDRLMKGDPTKMMEFWHEGRCGRCRRKLTVPESIKSGLGPVCAGL